MSPLPAALFGGRQRPRHPPHERRALSLQPPLRPPLALRPGARPSAPPTNARSAAWLPDPRPSPGCPRLWGRHAGRCARHPCTSPRLLSPAEGRVGPFRLQTARPSAPLVRLTRAGQSMTTEGWGWPGVASASLLNNCPAASRSQASVSPAGSARVQRVRLRGAGGGGALCSDPQLPVLATSFLSARLASTSARPPLSAGHLSITDV